MGFTVKKKKICAFTKCMEFVERGDIKIGMLQKATGNVKITETK